jgi:16S rRNA processing protein RimM
MSTAGADDDPTVGSPEPDVTERPVTPRSPADGTSPAADASAAADAPPANVEVTVGKIGRAHGLRGDVFLEVRTDEPELRFAPGTRFGTRRGVLVLESTRWHGARLLAKFAEASNREGAELLRGIELRLDVPAQRRPDDPEEFYDHQLRGLAAHLDNGAEIGLVSDVLHLPGQDMLVLDSGGREVLVPFVAEIVTSVDLDSGRLEIADRPGLLSDPPRADGEPEA